jgi:mono/diheme cytochrome c family protein
MKRTLATLAGLFLSLGVMGLAYSQGDDVFAFIPDGGRTLLAEVLGSDLPAATRDQLLTGKHTSAEWLAIIGEAAGGAPSLADLDEKQRQTLADYLGHNMPLPLPPQPATTRTADQWASALPQDGRDMALNYCQSCHIITVVVTQDRAREAWLGTLHKPSHIEVDLTEEQRSALADYLVVNAGISIEDVPPALRAGGASY